MAFFLIDPAVGFPNPSSPQPISAGCVYEGTAKYTLPVGVAAAAVVQMVPLPARARVIDVVAGVTGTSTTFTVGDGDDVDRFITSGAVAAGAIARMNAATGMGYNYPAADTVDIVLGGTPTAGAVVLLTVQYVIE